MRGKFSNFVDLLRYRAEVQSDKVAFTFLPDGEVEVGSLTYAALNRQAKEIAARLQNLNAQGERALLLYPPGLEFICAFLGCLYAGVIATPAYPPRANRSIDRLQAIIDDAQAKFALTTQNALTDISRRFQENGANRQMYFLATDTLEETAQWQEIQPQPQDLAFLQYTSGSTGMPKGVMVSHGNLLHNSHLINLCFQDTEESKGVSWLPPYHDMGLIGGILQPLYVGAFMALIPPVSFLQRPYRWLQAISRYRATTSGGPNFAYDFCLSQVTTEQRESLDLSCWQLAFTGAEPVRAETLAKFADYFAICGFRQQAFYPCYGMAETTLIVSGGIKGREPRLKTLQTKELEENKAVEAQETAASVTTLVSCGKSLANQKIIIVNVDTLSTLPDGEIGEIWVAGESVAQGYWQKEEQTQTTFSAYTSDTMDGPFLRTGDLGFLAAGELFVTGRLKDLIIIRGRNYYPQDLELTVDNCHPALRSGFAAAFAIDVKGKERLVIVQEIQRTYLRNLNVNEVTRAIIRAISESHELRPYAIALIKTNTIPKTSSGKIQRYACKAGFLDGSLSIVGQWPQEDGEIGRRGDGETKRRGNREENSQSSAREMENWLAEQLAEAIGVPKQEIEINEPFANYGLDSLKAVRLSAQLEDWLGRKLSPTLIYDYPNIASLAHYLANDGQVEIVAQNFANSTEPIAVVGLGCRFPGANNPQEFWQLLCQGKDAITQVFGRWQGKDWGGFLTEVDRFDAQFFAISPREAARMDPQQRLLLEVTWEALEYAGISADSLMGSDTGVFVGISSSDYAQLQLHYGIEPDAYAGTGNAHSIAANRLSYFFDWRGPSMGIDTACSSSLVAIHLACQSLRHQECQIAIASGVNLLLSPELNITFTKAGMMAADGRCKTFDASADGYVRGEGCGAIVLKRLEDAKVAGDNILAVIKGTAINQDGRSNGLTAPNGLAQQAVIKQALANAKVDAAAISYLEAHGTGTSLGDPIEVNSLKSVLMSNRLGEQTCWLGSVKTNIGHLEAAAGIAGTIKTILALQNQKIPPHLHFQEINPHIDLENTPIKISTQLQSWETQGQPRLAGISSFGFGGTNAHIILAEAKSDRREEKEAREQKTKYLFTLSAKNATALLDLAQKYLDFLPDHQDISLGDICFSANQGRMHFKHRLAIVADSREDLQGKLTTFTSGKTSYGVIRGDVKGNAKIAFLFTGQGCQYPGMGEQLYQSEPVFREALSSCAEILNNYLEKPLLEVLYGEDNHLLDETMYAQPALFAIEYALTQLWAWWGVKPDAVIGHSFGEYVAACVAGVFSLEDGLKLIAQRAKLMQSLPDEGEMVAVFAGEEEVKKVIASLANVTIAAINSSQNIVISGAKTSLNRVIARLKQAKIKTRKLRVARAFHSPLMQPMVDKFLEMAKEINYGPAQIDIISNLTGKVVGEEIATPEYWAKHILQPVEFARSIESLHQENYEIFLEIGSKPILLSLARQCLPNLKAAWLTSLRTKQEDLQQIYQSLASLYCRGINITLPTANKVVLPTYPFQKQRYWLEGKNNLPTNSETKDWYYQVQWLPQSRANENICFKQQEYWLIFADRSQGLGKKIAKQLEENQQSYLLIYSGESYRQIDDFSVEINPQNPEHLKNLLLCNPPQPNLVSGEKEGAGDKWNFLLSEKKPAKIIHLWSLDDGDLEQGQILTCGSVLYLLQTLFATPISAQLWLITKGSQAVKEKEKISGLAATSLWGLGKVIAIEHPEYWGGLIDLSTQSHPEEITQLLREIQQKEREEEIAFRDDGRYVRRLTKANISESKSIKIKSDRTYLIAGGLGGLGLQIAQWLVEKNVRYLVLLGRTKPSVEAQEIIQQLKDKGTQIFIAPTDITQIQELEKILKQCQELMPPLAGIINTVGVLDDGFLQKQTWNRFTKVLKPKILGSWNLHQLTEKMDLDLFINFSSIASLIGSPAQGNYAAANAFLDALAYHRQSLSLPSLTINWGPWAQTGMAAAVGFKRQGIESISPEAGLKSLELLLSNGHCQIGVANIDWQILPENFAYIKQSPYFSQLVPETKLNSGQKAAEKSNIFTQLLTKNDTEREELLKIYLQDALAKIMQIETEKISFSDSLIELGMDSLMVMEAIDRLQEDLQLMLYPREFYERPKIKNLAKYLTNEFAKTHLGKQTETTEIIHLTATKKTKKSQRKIQEKISRPILFILSSPRSGSTLLRVMLAGHPQLCSPPELHLLPFNTMEEREEELGISQLGEGLKRALIELKKIDAQTSQKIIEKLIADKTSIAEVYRQLQELAGERLLVDKSPTYANDIQTLMAAEQIFTNAKYIQIVRHPYAVIESFTRMRMDKLITSDNTNPYKLAETIWTQSNKNIADFFNTIDNNRRHIIRYEDLVSQPEKTMREICQFLNIPFTESLLQPYQGERMTDGVHSNSMSVGDPNFLKHQTIEARFAQSWQEITLPISLNAQTQELTNNFAYELAEKEIAPEPKMKETSIDVRGLRLCLCIWGPEEGPLVLCLHGILEQGAAWSEVAINLAKKGYRVIAPDLRGHGKSDHVGKGGSYNLLDFLADLDAIAEKIAERAFTLVGHSLGSVIAGIFASIRPQRIANLVLVEPVLPSEGNNEEAAAQLVTHLDYLAQQSEHPIFPDVKTAVERLRQATPALSETLALMLAERITEPCEGGVRWRWASLLRTRAGIEFNGIGKGKYLGLLRRIKAPITLIYGDRSNFNRQEDLLEQEKAMTKAEKFVISGGHNLHLEAPSALAKIITGLLK